jgi:hypothetical protein
MEFPLLSSSGEDIRVGLNDCHLYVIKTGSNVLIDKVRINIKRSGIKQKNI